LCEREICRHTGRINALIYFKSVQFLYWIGDKAEG